MAHWTIKSEIDNGTEHDLIVLITNDGREFETMFDAPDQYIESLRQGIGLTTDETGAIVFLTKHYSFETAADVVTAFRFKDDDDVVDAKFMLAPHPDESDFSLFDVWDAKDCLKMAGISGRKFSKILHVSERTMRNRLNPNEGRSTLNLAEKYLLKVLSNKNNG